MGWMIRRTMKNLIRKPLEKIISIFLISAVLAALFCSIFVMGGASKAREEIRKQLGNEVKLERKENFSPLRMEDAEILKSSSYIKDINYDLNFGVTTKLKPVEFQTGSTTFSPAVAKGKGGSQYVFDLDGCTRAGLQTDFHSGKLKLSEGRDLNEKDAVMKQTAAVISKKLAEKNRLKPGSLFIVETLNGKTKRTLVVVGIFEQESSEKTDIYFSMDMDNTIFIPLQQAQLLQHQSDPAIPEESLSNVSYYLDSPFHTAEFKRDAEKMGLDLQNLKLDARDEEYTQKTDPINTVWNYAAAACVISIAAGTGMLIFLFYSAIKRRREEIGFFTVIGIKRTAIVFLCLTEMLAVFLLAFLLALYLGWKTADPLANQVVRTESMKMVWMEDPRTSTMKVSVSGVSINKSDDNQTVSIGYTKSEDGDEIHINPAADAWQVMEICLLLLFIFLSSMLALLFSVRKFRRAAVLQVICQEGE